MKINYVCMAVFALGIMTAVSCGQDPIFYIISQETTPVEPLIKGAPTNMVTLRRTNTLTSETGEILCVASDHIYWYAKKTITAEDDTSTSVSMWNLPEYYIPHPGGKITALAVTTTRLYALCMDTQNVVSTIRYLELPGGTEWKTIAPAVNEYTLIQTIHADPATNRLFAGTGRNDNESASYAILFQDDNDTLQMLQPETKILSGAVLAGDTYFLSTIGQGVFQVSESDLADGTADTVTQLADASALNNNREFVGMIKLQDNQTVITVERKVGTLYTVRDGSFTPLLNLSGVAAIATGGYANGALALWEDYREGATNKALLIGKQDGLTSSYSYGYVELNLTSDGLIDPLAICHAPIQSVDGQTERYSATLGTHPVNHLFQAPKTISDTMVLFASTQTAGLWSYKNRPENGGLQWNAEN